eukprot:scpid91577/ scgid0747/ Poly(U)-binding-splicing factor PUF60; 60 kDa poly(U)-binding-splicing factor
MDFDIRPVKRSVWDEVDDFENGDHHESSSSGCIIPYEDLSMTQKANLRQAKKFCEALTSQWRDVSGITRQQQFVQQQQQTQLQQLMQAQESSQRQKAFSVMCRIYIGSISFEMHENQVKEAFSPFGPIKSLDMSWDSVTMKHKGFCFIEYFVPEAAQLALDQMNGVLLGGRNVKVGRPSSVPAAAPYIDKLIKEAQMYNRVYVSAVSTAVPESDVRSTFERCGPLRSLQLSADGNKGHRGFGYAEFETAQAVEIAVNKMNLMQMGGSYMRICKAVTPPFALQVPASTTLAAQNLPQVGMLPHILTVLPLFWFSGVSETPFLAVCVRARVC